jgi:hypothetical protein
MLKVFEAVEKREEKKIITKDIKNIFCILSPSFLPYNSGNCVKK